MDEKAIRQAYLEGFEGGNLTPERASMVEAYVNGLNGQFVSNEQLCELGGFKVKDKNSARTMIWKVFKSTESTHAERYYKEREYVTYLQVRNQINSEWSADVIRQRLQRNVMYAQAEIPFDKLITAAHKGMITTRVVRVRELDLSAANTALHLLGKQLGMFGEGAGKAGLGDGTAGTEQGRELNNTERAARVLEMLRRVGADRARSDTAG